MRDPDRRARAFLVAGLLGIAAACSEPEPVERARVAPAVADVGGSEVAGGDGGDGMRRAGGNASDRVANPTPGIDAVLCVDTARSRIRWRGTKVGGSHEGVVRVQGGRIRVRGDVVLDGTVVVDMRSIAVTDIPEREVEARRNLRTHLAHEEFFSVDRFPTARFDLTAVEGGREDVYAVTGNLAIRDSVHSVTFDAVAPVVSEQELWLTAHFSIDRQRWNIDFDGRTSAIRNALVHDLIQLGITLMARPEACPTGV